MTNPRNRKFEWQDRMLESSTLTSKARLMGLALSLKDNGNGNRWWMTDDAVMERTKLSRASVYRAREELVEAGWIKVTRQGGRARDGTTWATEYRLTFPRRTSAGWGAAAEQGTLADLPDADTTVSA